MALNGFIGILLLREYEQILQKQHLRIHHRQIRDTSNPFELPDFTFMTLFRLNKFTARLVVQWVEQHMAEGQRSTSIPNFLKVLVTLNFYGHGSYQINVGHSYNFGLSQPSVSRSIELVTNIMCNNLLNEWIVFPTTAADKVRKKIKFLNRFNFPRCLGVIDCTHIAIIAPPADHPLHPALPYYNRKGYYSVNVQIICDSELNIMNMNARFPGSVHDSAIWRSSAIRQHLEDSYVQGDDSCIIGDTGYPMQPWLLVPYDDVDENSPEERFNRVFLRARNTIERLNGVLKGRFRCLLKHRTLNYDPIKSARIVYCCGILHNIAQHYNNEIPDDIDEDDDDEADENNDEYRNHQENDENEVNWLQRGYNIRNEIVQMYFQ